MSLDESLLLEAARFVDESMVGTFRESTVRNALAAELSVRLPESEVIMEVSAPIMFQTSKGTCTKIGTHIADIIVRTSGTISVIELKVNAKGTSELQARGYMSTFGADAAFVVVFYYLADVEVTKVH